MEDKLARIEAFVLDQLSQEDRAAFEAELVADAVLAAEVAQFREAQAAAEAQGQVMLKASFREKYQAGKTNSGLSITWYMAAAAAVLVLALVYWWSRPESALTTDALYAQYNQPVDLSLERGSGAADSLFSLANAAYQAGEFEGAIPLLEELLADSTFDRKPYARLHLGICYQQLRQWEVAEQALEAIPPASSFYYQARWHLALISLKQEDVTVARTRLQLLVDQSRTYGPQAQELLQALQKLPPHWLPAGRVSPSSATPASSRSILAIVRNTGFQPVNSRPRP
ncbi:MAG: tetratricopeptide repeat protein [Bacteroidota bacterium]